MNPPSYLSPSPSMASAGQGTLAGKSPFAGLSLNGVMLFSIGLLVVASGYMALRPKIMGLALHLSLVPIALSFPLVLLSRINLMPVRIVVALAAFLAIYSFSIFNGTSFSLSEMFKVIASTVTIVTCALLVRKRGDFVAGAVGLSIGVALLALPGLTVDSATGVEAMEGANKNSYSLFALPALLVAGFICTRWKTVPVVFKAVMVGCMLIQLAAIFMGGNRSGYVGAAVVGLMLFWDQRGKGMLLVGALALGVFVLMVNLGRTEVFDRRFSQTVEGNKSDDLRIAIIKACTEIAFENPIIGVSPQRLPFEIARKVDSVNASQVDSHNVFGHISAGSGLVCLSALFAAGWAMWTWGPGLRKLAKDDPLYAPRKLLRMMVILWVIRGFFSREVLYNPALCIALGLAIGICVVAQQERNRRGNAITPPSRDPRLGLPGGLSW